MKLLILGGTIFLGRHLVEAALAQGHEITLFNRGQHNPDLYPAIERLRGDRDGDLTALGGRRWDAVIDTCGYVPRVARASAELLSGAVEHYTFISSISVYADFSSAQIDEHAPVGTLADTTVEEITGETYGPLKALCEQAVQQALPNQTLIVRPGLIVGPHDPSDRFTYWPRRIARGGDVLAPDQPDQPVEIIDVRDLAAWIVQMVAARQTGTYNATGPAEPLTLAQVLAACKSVSGSTANIVWVAKQFLLDAGAVPWTEIPLWTPMEEGQAGSVLTVNCAKAITAGLSFRPLADTIRDTLAWDSARPADTKYRAGLDPQREQEWLRAWHERGSAQ
jgi:2'-hydroxyisoflavone reductase